MPLVKLIRQKKTNVKTYWVNKNSSIKCRRNFNSKMIISRFFKMSNETQIRSSRFWSRRIIEALTLQLFWYSKPLLSASSTLERYTSWLWWMVQVRFLYKENILTIYKKLLRKKDCEPSCPSVTCIINLSSDSLTFYSFVEFP